MLSKLVQRLVPKLSKIRPLSSTAQSPINCYTEWDPLEEIIVGRPEGSAFAPWEQPLVGIVANDESAQFLMKNAGKAYPPELVKKASKEVGELVKVLELEGVTVTRPDYYDATKPFTTPTFHCDSGYQNSVPRDIFITMGDTIVEAPVAMRSRFFEYVQYRNLLKNYFDRGAKWIAVPKPAHTEELYNKPGTPGQSAVTEHEIVFDAAVFQRCGKDVFMRRSMLANQSGLDWMVRHFPQFRFHELVYEMRGMHLDVTFTPLAPGKVLINPRRPILNGNLKHGYTTYDGKEGEITLPEIFKGWDVFVALSHLSASSIICACPAPHRGDRWFWHCSSDILGVNVLSLDEKRVICAASEPKIVKQFEEWGFQPIPIEFDHAMYFGGGFHCHTVDIRRRGGMQDYFS